MPETALFYIISAVALLAAFGVILSRSAVYSVLWLVLAMCMIAGLFVLLKAFLVATILVLVYAGAILVLFLFVVMLVDIKTTSFEGKGFGISPLIAVALACLLLFETARVILTLSPAMPAASPHGTAEALGRLLFNRYVLPFELTSFLVLAAVVSVTVLAKKGAEK